MFRCPRVLHRRCLIIKPCSLLPQAIKPVYTQEPKLGLHRVEWPHAPKNVYVVKKPQNEKVLAATAQFLRHVNATYPNVNLIVSDAAALLSVLANDPITVFSGDVKSIVEKTDLLVTLGGDGTILRGVQAFSNVNVPPVLSFALGTLGFLLPFDFATFDDSFRAVMESRSRAMRRTRLECHVVKNNRTVCNHMLHSMNDVSLHRGSQAHLILLDIYIDGEFLTTTTADGIVCASPTGSTAYSLSAGGSIANPLVPCILLTPVCPRSLSFRPLILPSTSNIMIRLAPHNRNKKIDWSIDGVPQSELKPGDEIHIVSERQGGLYCIARGVNDWTKGINELLGFNSLFKASES